MRLGGLGVRTGTGVGTGVETEVGTGVAVTGTVVGGGWTNTCTPEIVLGFARIANTITNTSPPINVIISPDFTRSIM